VRKFWAAGGDLGAEKRVGSRVGALRAVRRFDSGRSIIPCGQSRPWPDAETRVPPGRGARPFVPGNARSVQTEEDGTLLRSIFRSYLSDRCGQSLPKKFSGAQSRNVAISASSPIARDVSGTSLDTSCPGAAVISQLAKRRRCPAAVIGTSSVFCRRTCVTPTARVGMIFPCRRAVLAH